MITETAATIPEGTIKRLHVDQKRIKANTKDGTDLAPITIQTSQGPFKGHEAEIVVGGQVVARFIYKPQDPLSCGARLWIETTAEVRSIVR
jgi:hypothetical protein